MKKSNKVLAFILAILMIFTFSFSKPVNAAGASIKKVVVRNSLTDSTKIVYIAKGKTVKLNTTVTADPDTKANKKVKYKSANSKIATVTKDGEIKGKKPGKTKITVTSKKNPKKKATIKVTVKASSVKNVSIISPESNILTEGDSLQLKATVKGKKTAYKKTRWLSSDNSIATVSKTGGVKAIAPGKVKITVTSVDGSNKKGELELTVKAKNSDTADNSEKINLLSLNVIDKSTFSFQLSGKASVTSDDISVLIKDNSTDKYENELEVDKISTKDKITYKVSLSDKASFTEKGYVKVNISSLTGEKSLEKEYKIISGNSTDAEVKASSISLSNSIISIIRGRKDTLSVSFTPENTTDKTCEWESADPSIATVDSDGNVYGHKKGFTEITVTHKSTGLKTTCTVYVNALASVSTQQEIEESLKDDIDELVVKTGAEPLVIPSGSYTDMTLTVCGNGMLTNNGRFKEVNVSSDVNYIENSINIVNGVKNGTLTNMKGALNPKDFGAQGNGTDDDTNAFRKMLYFAYNNNIDNTDGIRCLAIFIPTGKYRITGPLVGKNVQVKLDNGKTENLNLQGARFEISGSGRESTIIYFDGTKGDVLIDNKDIFGYSTFRDIGFVSDGQKRFMDFECLNDTGNAQRFQFISCGFNSWGQIINCKDSFQMLSEITFAYCKIQNGGSADNPCTLFTLYDPQAVNWRFIETDIETFNGDAFRFEKGSCISIIGGSIIPAYKNNKETTVFNFVLKEGKNADTAAPGNSPQIFCDGTRFEIKGRSSLIKTTTHHSHTAKISFKTCCFAITADDKYSSPNGIYLQGALDAFFDECYGCSGLKINGNLDDISNKDTNGYPGLIEPTLHFVNCARINIDTIVENSKNLVPNIRDRNNPRIIIDDQYDFYLKNKTYAHTKDGLNLCRQTVTLSDGGSKVNISNGKKYTINQYGYVNYVELNVTANSDYTKYPMTVDINGVKQTIDFKENKIYKFEINDYIDNVDVTFNHDSSSDLKVDMNMAIIKY